MRYAPLLALVLLVGCGPSPARVAMEANAEARAQAPVRGVLRQRPAQALQGPPGMRDAGGHVANEVAGLRQPPLQVAEVVRLSGLLPGNLQGRHARETGPKGATLLVTGGAAGAKPTLRLPHPAIG